MLAVQHREIFLLCVYTFFNLKIFNFLFIQLKTTKTAITIPLFLFTGGGKRNLRLPTKKINKIFHYTLLTGCAET